MTTYGYQKQDAGDAGQFTVTITTPDGVTGAMLFTRTEAAAAAIAGILQSDQDTRDVTRTGMPPGRELINSQQLAARLLREAGAGDEQTGELLMLFGRVFVAGMEAITGPSEL
jgi:hypothetical protein